MIKYPIPPEFCLIINAFNKTKSLREAAKLLGMEPAALVRKVRLISAEYDFIEKIGNRWSVTPQGQKIAQWTEDIIIGQAKLLDQNFSYRISAFGWMIEEMLLPNFHHLEKAFEDNVSWHFNLTATNLENEVIQGKTDFVITGHAPNDPSVAHKKIRTHSWIVIVPKSWGRHVSNLSSKQLMNFLDTKPYIRHAEMNPEQVLGHKPRTEKNILVDSIIGVRSAVCQGLGWSAVPLMSVQNALKDGKILKLDVSTHIQDHVSIWWLRSRKELTPTAHSISKWISSFKA